MNSESSGIHVIEAAVRFLLEDPNNPGSTTGELYTLTFNLRGDAEDAVGSLYFGDDYGRATGFVPLERVTEEGVDALRRRLEGQEAGSVRLTVEPSDEPPGSGSRVAWHEEKTCHWYDLR